MMSHAALQGYVNDLEDSINADTKEQSLLLIGVLRSLIREQEAAILGEIKSINTRLSEQIQISREALKCRSS